MSVPRREEMIAAKTAPLKPKILVIEAIELLPFQAVHVPPRTRPLSMPNSKGASRNDAINQTNHSARNECFDCIADDKTFSLGVFPQGFVLSVELVAKAELNAHSLETLDAENSALLDHLVLLRVGWETAMRLRDRPK
ncbi:MAG: hypothetical protein ACK56Q_01330 [Pirellulaceae bacterium]